MLKARLCVLILALFLFDPLTLTAQNDWVFSLNVVAKEIGTNKQMDGMSIQIFKAGTNERVYAGVSSGNSAVKFNLSAETDYSVKLQKPGFVTKTINVSTKNVPVQDKNVPSYLYDLIIEVLAEKPDEDYSSFRQPFGMIVYDVSQKDFAWIVNMEAKEAERKIKEKRDGDNKNEETEAKKDKKTKSREELEKIKLKKEQAEQRALEKEKMFEEERKRKEEEKKAYFEKFKKITEAPDPNQKIVEDILFESIEGMNYIETKTTIVLTNGEKVVFRKIAFDWGGNYYKQDKYDITAEVYDLLTLKVFVKK